MAHLQHNRVATGLIDFTYGPLIALWVACQSSKIGNNEETAGKVFMVHINADRIEEINTQDRLNRDLKEFFRQDGKWYLWQPSIDNSDIDTDRITIQQSVFLFGKPSVGADMIQKEIVIPPSIKKELIQRLEIIGISEKVLFSDFAGYIERNGVESTYDVNLAEGYLTQKMGKKRKK